LEKSYVRSLFDAIAHRYDLLNHLLSGGIDFYWRRKAVEQLRDLRPRQILDVAAGTGDFAIAALRLKPEMVIGIDIAERMLELGRRKLDRRGLDSIIQLRSADAENLPFATNSFDAAIVAFGVRNFENLHHGLREMHRVIRPGGRIVVLEFSKPAAFPFEQVYFFYFKRVVPLIGKAISRNAVAYGYLRDTVMKFPEGAQFLAILERAGFSDTRQQRMTLGIASVYTGTKRD
jgi:demethylmenaquinone methyltransferase/2-methoxy-6-polyprenyl-1,4-benzoquinol methylase